MECVYEWVTTLLAILFLAELTVIAIALMVMISICRKVQPDAPMLRGERLDV